MQEQRVGQEKQTQRNNNRIADQAFILDTKRQSTEDVLHLIHDLPPDVSAQIIQKNIETLGHSLVPSEVTEEMTFLHEQLTDAMNASDFVNISDTRFQIHEYKKTYDMLYQHAYQKARVEAGKKLRSSIMPDYYDAFDEVTDGEFKPEEEKSFRGEPHHIGELALRRIVLPESPLL